MSERIYLDWAATTPLCPEALAALEPYCHAGKDAIEVQGNANSLHSVGRHAFSALEDARAKIARCLGARRSDEVIFTSGATEADNAAIFGIIDAVVAQKQHEGQKNFVPHLITSEFEHEAVLMAAQVAKRHGCEVTLLKPSRQGFIELDTLKEALQSNTVLVSVMAVNNELGTIQPIKELAACAHEAGTLFHSDMVQLLGKVAFNLEELGVDAASFSAHKICGPKGVGALYLRNRTPFFAWMVGGGQEMQRRSGTQNVAGVQCFAAACEASCRDLEDQAARLCDLRDMLYLRLTQYPGVRATLNVEPGSTLHVPTIVHVLVEGFESETLILRLDMQGVCVSGGSACAAHDIQASHVLRSLGLSADEALGSLRISMGRFTTAEDIEGFLAAFDKALHWDS